MGYDRGFCHGGEGVFGEITEAGGGRVWCGGRRGRRGRERRGREDEYDGRGWTIMTDGSLMIIDHSIILSNHTAEYDFIPPHVRFSLRARAHVAILRRGLVNSVQWECPGIPSCRSWPIVAKSRSPELDTCSAASRAACPRLPLPGFVFTCCGRSCRRPRPTSE